MRERHVLLLILLCLLAALKWGYNPGLGRNALDGDYYYQIARHVAEGDGLVTSVSLYHQGFKELPHPINIYPLWPLLLGYSGFDARQMEDAVERLADALDEAV